MEWLSYLTPKVQCVSFENHPNLPGGISKVNHKVLLGNTNSILIPNWSQWAFNEIVSSGNLSARKIGRGCALDRKLRLWGVGVRLCLLPSEMKSCYISRPKPYVIVFRIVPAIFLVRNTQLKYSRERSKRKTPHLWRYIDYSHLFVSKLVCFLCLVVFVNSIFIRI